MSAITVTTGNVCDLRHETGGSLKARAPRLIYVPMLDGLRALAVLAVLFYHADLPWMAGGFLGVEIFFVISGYLITSLLLAEQRQIGRLDLGAFWLRRARRLFPALITLLTVVVGFVVIFLPDEAAGLRGDVLSAAGYMSNWYQVFGHKSYFQSVGRPSLLLHLWSLAVEEQFYLLWPPLFGLLMRHGGPRFTLWAVVACALSSSGWMAALYQPDVDPSRLYYGTDTRAAGLLTGAALAFLWPSRRETAGGPGAWITDGVGAVALAVLLLCLVRLEPLEPFLYRGGFALTGLLTAVLIALGVNSPGGWVCRTLSCRALRWVGARSYGIYLWHFPVFMLTRPQLDVPAAGLPLLAARFALTALLAAASFRFLEAPIRSGALGRSWRAWQTAQGRSRHLLALRWCSASACITLLFAVLGGYLAIARSPASPAYLCTAPAITVPSSAAILLTADSGSASTDIVASAWQAAATGAVPAVVVQESPAPVGIDASMAADPEAVTAIGDSVMLGVSAELQNALGTDLVLDAVQGRLPLVLPAVVRRLRAEGKVNPTVIIHIGNNGSFSARAFDRTMAELKEARQVVVLNVKVPRNWQDPNNTMLAAAVRRYPNAVLVDWYAASVVRPELFRKDGLHLRPAGAKVYAQLVAQAVRGLAPTSAPPGGEPGAGELASAR